LNVIQGADLVSAYPIIAVDLRDEKLHLARQFGATHCINAAQSDSQTEVFKIVGEVGVDVAIDCTGRIEILELAYQVTRTEGKTILLSGPRAGYQVQIDPFPLHFSRVLMGFQVITESRPHEEIPRYIKLANAGKLKLRELITDYCDLEGINAIVERMRRGSLRGRCVIKLSEA
ncbi:MAG: zinc-binding dehydrogenase, partial [Candidatus Poribacteria bacterium]|nr:zinc-binding dehydrogenase [Candidatus Poribacteria bacterium]